MEANVPEKIYLQHLEDGRLWPAWFTAKILNDDIEYTRTDAFIEKICEWLEPNVKIILCGDKIDTDRFIEEFKKYMKGE